MPYIHRLRLTDFRSYIQLDLELDGRPVVLFGSNGSGKTNLLEAISFLSPGRGLRRAKMEDITHQSPAQNSDTNHTPSRFWGVHAHWQSADESLKISIGQVPESPGRRTIRIDGKNTTGAELARHVRMIWLTPAQDRLFTGPAADRRRFLDRFTLAHDPVHGLNTLRYEKARTERNRLLSDRISDWGWYEALEADMATHSARIARARVETVNKLICEIDARSESEFPKADIALQGYVEAMVQQDMSEDDVILSVKDYLAENRALDMRAGRTLEGVHKSDLVVTYAAKAMPASECSTGEQKALLIGLTLAQARSQQDHMPLMLLDEVAAHLDENRRAALIEELIALGIQTFMTGTDAHLFKAFQGRAQTFSVANSQLQDMSETCD